jgi:lipopolysaccharide biosynthesis protein
MDIASSPHLALLHKDWTFHPTTASWRIRLNQHIERTRGRIPAPAHELLVAPTRAEASAWTLYFVYLPDGCLDPSHRFTLDRLRALGRQVLVVCATPTVSMIPEALVPMSDALIWKALPGFDFSAYSIGLRTLADHCLGCDVLVLNDSTFGPLVDLQPWLARAQWDLTGFTATANVQNHIQSYAYHLRGVTPERLAALASVFPRNYAYDRFWAVVLGQETQFARVANHSMSVGAFLFSDSAQAEDPMLQLALPLVESGFPFLKRSLLGKLAHLASRDEILSALSAAGYPL